MRTGNDSVRWALLASSVIALCACESPLFDDDLREEVEGSGVIASEVRTLGSFTGMSVSGGFQVDVIQSDVEEVEITAEDNLIRFIRTDVIDGTLVVEPDAEVRLRPTESIVVRIQAHEISELSVSGAVILDADVGSVDELNVQVSGAALVRVVGSAEWQGLHLSGASTYHGLDLETDESVVTLSGASRAEVWVHDRLEVNGSGASVVRYRGHPTVIARVTGASTVMPVN